MRTFEQEELDDIRGLYRDAKDKEAQIGVLCDLYDTDRASIFAALGMQEDAEREEAAASSARQKPRRKRFSAEEKAAAVTMVRAGATQREVADKIGVCEYTIYAWMREARQKEAVEPKSPEGDWSARPLHRTPVNEVNGCGPLLAAEPKSPKKRKVRSYEQTVRDDVVRAVMLEGLTQREAAERYGIPQANISVWIKKAKARMAEFGVEPEAEEESAGSSQSPEETERAADEKKGDAAPAQPDDAARREEMLAFANRTLEELREGVAGLESFILNFAGVDILSDDEWEMLERILHTVTVFAAGVETGIAIWRDWP